MKKETTEFAALEFISSQPRIFCQQRITQETSQVNTLLQKRQTSRMPFPSEGWLDFLRFLWDLFSWYPLVI